MGALRGFWSTLHNRKCADNDASAPRNRHYVHLCKHTGPSLLGAELAFMKELEAALVKERIQLARSPSAGAPTVNIIMYRGGSRTQRTMEDLIATHSHLADPSSID